MTFMVTIKVDGVPVPKGRARYVRRGNHISTYTPEKTRTYETLIKKPDASNILKSVEDGMNGVVYHDDSQIINIHVTKVYSSLPGVDICVKECLE